MNALSASQNFSGILTIADAKGAFVRSLRVAAGAVIGFHPRFGFISEAEVERRLEHRVRRGLRTPLPETTGLTLSFQIGADGRTVAAGVGCEIASQSSNAYQLNSPLGAFALQWADSAAPAAPLPTSAHASEQASSRALDRVLATALCALFLVFGILVTQMRRAPVAVEAIPEPVAVTVIPEKRVVVPKLTYQVTTQENRDLKVQTNEKQVKRAIQQDLGFLGLLGRKDLKKALGGMPTDLKNVSPGAGAGGNAGSGGELLVGLGQGVHRTTVGNTGVAGLGGIGTKGAGGGAGGYGNSMVGSGEGRGLTSMPLSDEMVLEGGLDRIVIQATIAKYISQVRACYEQGLKRKPGLNGQVGMQFEVGPSGRLNYSRVGKSTLGDAEVEQCIATRMMGWQFPKPLGGVNVKVNYPFLLRPVSS